MENMKKVQNTGIMNKMRDKMPLIIIILIISFLATIIFEWGMNYMGMGGKVDAFGKVNSDEITYQEFERIVQQQLDQMRSQNQGKDITEEQIKQTRDQVWESMVSQALTKQAIAKYGITVSNEEILDWIYNRPETLPEPIKRNFMDSTGVFNIGFYQQALNMKTKEATQFWSQVENFIRESLLSEKLQAVITEGAVLSEADVLDKYKETYIFANFNYVLLDLNTVKDSSKFAVTDNDLKKYYDENKIDFKQVENVKLKFVTYQNLPSVEDSSVMLKQMSSFQKQMKTLEIADSSLIKFINENSSTPYTDAFQKPSAFDAPVQSFLFNANVGDVSDPLIGQSGYHVAKLLGVKEGTDPYASASHVLIKISENDSAGAKTKATEIYNRVKNGENIETIAFEISDDPSAKQNKGNLGWFTKGAMVKEFEDAAFNNPEGSVIGPVKTSFGYHIIKVTGKTNKEFQVAQITKAVTPSSRSIQQTKRNAEEFYQEAKKPGVNFDTLAIQKKLLPQVSGEIDRNGMIPNAGKDKGTLDFVFDNKVGSVTEPVKVSNGYSVFQIFEKTPEGYRNFDSVKTTVIKPKVINEKKYQALLGVANDLSGKINNGDILSLKSVAPEYIYETADSVTVLKPNAIIGTDYAVTNAIFKMKPGEISKPIKGQKGYYIIKLNSVTEFSESDYLLKAPDIRKSLFQAKRQQIVTEWLQKMQADADIIDNRNKYLN
ncbi:MAG TPA: peptidylprolyl isomerase [Ignavibacteria bacterium]|nr:peptidylprolyl isomerase [Ignavibacteria bacterium]